MCNNPRLDLINMNVYIKFWKILSICSQDIEGNKIFVGWVIGTTAPELWRKCDFFPEKEDEKNIGLCSGIYAYVR